MTDELAYEAKQDPLAFRLDMMKPHKAHEYAGWGAEVIDSGRMAKCYESAAKMAKWGRELPKGHGLGIAGHFTFGSYAAFVIEVSVSNKNKLVLHDAWGAIDCGFDRVLIKPVRPRELIAVVVKWSAGGKGL